MGVWSKMVVLVVHMKGMKRLGSWVEALKVGGGVGWMVEGGEMVYSMDIVICSSRLCLRLKLTRR